MHNETDFAYHFTGQRGVYHGKVRDVYSIGSDLLVMVASDRISAFDVVLPRRIPYKGAVLTQIAAKYLEGSRHICPNWLMAVPAPHIAVGHKCEPFRVEMVIRGYLTGHAWRVYKSGGRSICGVPLPNGLKEHDPLPEPIITPATKADSGHDEDISREEILRNNIVPEWAYTQMEQYTRALFELGTEVAAQRDLILVDTKYEFGLHQGKVTLMDEVHTPDSSRYFYADGYTDRQSKGEPQRQLSKEFVREWLMANGFQGMEGQQVPEMSDQWVRTISERYIELYEQLLGEHFDRAKADIEDAMAMQHTELVLQSLGAKSQA